MQESNKVLIHSNIFQCVIGMEQKTLRQKMIGVKVCSKLQTDFEKVIQPKYTFYWKIIFIFTLRCPKGLLPYIYTTPKLRKMVLLLCELSNFGNAFRIIMNSIQLKIKCSLNNEIALINGKYYIFRDINIILFPLTFYTNHLLSILRN